MSTNSTHAVGATYLTTLITAPHVGKGRPPLTPGQRERWAERAAIREFDGGLPRAEAERLALADVLQQPSEDPT